MANLPMRKGEAAAELAAALMGEQPIRIYARCECCGERNDSVMLRLFANPMEVFWCCLSCQGCIMADELSEGLKCLA